MDTEHTVVEHWDAGRIKFLTGTVGMKYHDGRPAIKPVMSFVILIEDESSTKVQQLVGAVGRTNV